jgi:hypothetical protein
MASKPHDFHPGAACAVERFDHVEYIRQAHRAREWASERLSDLAIREPGDTTHELEVTLLTAKLAYLETAVPYAQWFVAHNDPNIGCLAEPVAMQARRNLDLPSSSDVSQEFYARSLERAIERCSESTAVQWTNALASPIAAVVAAYIALLGIRRSNRENLS